MAAAVLARAFGRMLSIELIESEQIGTVGVGEATIPQIRLLTSLLGIDESEFLSAVDGTVKLGIQFAGWGKPDAAYMHAFGPIGRSLGLLPFSDYWLRAAASDRGENLWDYSFNLQAALANRYAPTGPLGDTGVEGLVHAFHFDATRVARYLREYAQRQGVLRTEGRIEQVTLEGETGSIASLRLDDRRTVTGDMFLDCTGFRSLLLGAALGVGYRNWQQWLPCDRAVAQATTRSNPLRPYTQAFARSAGWQWRIPLQTRTGNGHVYCSRFLSDDEAVATLHANIEGIAHDEPRLLRFATGMRERVWERNCLALGLAAGFMEPLESTSIHLVQTGLQRLINLFPDARFAPAAIAAYNRETRCEYERVRDFLILHYHLNGRRGEPFWDECRAMGVPDELTRKIEQFATRGRLRREADELFTEVAWLQVFIGQGLRPARYHPLADQLSADQLDGFLAGIRKVIAAAVERLPLHADYLAGHCATPASG